MEDISKRPRKANGVSDVDAPPQNLPAGAYYVDDRPVSPDEGGVYSVPGLDGMDPAWFAQARAETVPRSTMPVPPNMVAGNRLMEVPVHTATDPKEYTYGGELEVFMVDHEGNPVKRARDKLPELYTFMDELSTKEVAHSADELFSQYDMMLRSFVDHAQSIGGLVLPASVFGQRTPSLDEQNPSPYVVEIVDQLTEASGFPTRQVFVVAGGQDHTGVHNTEAALQAGEAMQYLNPILMTSGLAGPWFEGEFADALRSGQLTDKQREHMAKVGMTEADLQGPYQSWRYLLRRLGSSEAGVWMQTAPDSTIDYFRRGHERLSNAEINTIDRLMGAHTDRFRAVLAGEGSSTFEGCASDTYLGNVNTMTANHVFRSALFKSLETSAAHGRHARDDLANRLGLGGMHRLARLRSAHRASLVASRHGNDAHVYDKKPGKWLPLLFEIADAAPGSQLTEEHKATIRDMFATAAETRSKLHDYDEAPGIDAYYLYGVNNPAYYMRNEYESIAQNYPSESREQLVRRAELATALAFHAARNTVMLV